MQSDILRKVGSISTILAGALFAASAVAVVIVPDGGLASPIAPAIFYAALIAVAVGAPAIAAAVGSRLAAIGSTMVTVGAIAYSGVVMVLIAGTSGVASWHDIWLFATINGILPIGAVLLLAGLVVLGFATRRSEIVPTWASIALRIGAAINLVAFFTAIPLSLPIGAAMLGSALVACGWVISRKARMPGQPEVTPAVPAYGVSPAPIHRFVTPPRPIL